MRRRELITLLGGAAIPWPFAACARQPEIPVVGFLSTRSAGESEDLVAGFRRGLKEADVTEGRNVAIEFRWADGQFDRLPALAAELAAMRVAVIAAVGGPLSTVAAKAAAPTIPIVFAMGDDPVKLGLVASYNQPGGDITGVAQFASKLSGKRLQLLREITPHAELIAVLVNPQSPDARTQSAEMEEAASDLGQRIVFLSASSVSQIDEAFVRLGQHKAGALVVTNDPLLNGRREQLAALASGHRVPAIYPWRENVEAGGLMSYGTSLADAYRQVGVYVGRILKGAKPADLPVVQPTRFELVINMKTAKALGLTIPQLLLAQADEVIE